MTEFPKNKVSYFRLSVNGTVYPSLPIRTEKFAIGYTFYFLSRFFSESMLYYKKQFPESILGKGYFMWVMIIFLSLALTVLGMIYLVRRFRKFGIVKKLSKGQKWLERLLGFLPLIGFVLYGVFDLVNAVVVLLHLVAFWLIGDGITVLIRWIFKKKEKAEASAEGEKSFPIYWTGIAVILFCAVYLSIGYYQAYHVEKTVYSLATEKPLPQGSLRIAHIADCHVGTTFSGEGFGTYLAEIQAQEPDLLVITGDFVDDSTSREDMLDACEALGEVDLPYGVFFVYGNHDKGYYNRDAYSPQELEACLETNGVTVLEDEALLIADTFYIVGRKDREAGHRNSGTPGRMPIEDLMKDLNPTKYTVVLNHQPNDYDAEAATNADLVLSGHTHGGQLIPLGPIGILMGANDRAYGKEVRGSTTFIVTSGISNWELNFKTGTKSEYVIIDIASP